MRSGSGSCSFLTYSCYAWGAPMLVVLLAVTADLLPVDLQLIDAYRPLYGRRFCWIGSRTALIAYFAAPIGALWITNVVMYMASARQIYLASLAGRPAAQQSTTGSSGLLVSSNLGAIDCVTNNVQSRSDNCNTINIINQPL